MNDNLKDLVGLEVPDDDVIDMIMSVPEHQSANLIVDIGGTAQSQLSIGIGGAGSGNIYAASGAVIGLAANLIAANTYCNLHVAGTPLFASGQLRIAVQVADADTSGSYADPTSGVTSFPTAFSSGGILILNSGGLGSGTLNGGTSGQNMQSGFSVYAAFLRNGQYARAVVLSGDFYAGTLTVGFVSQLKTTGSGAGSTQSPGSGVVSV